MAMSFFGGPGTELSSLFHFDDGDNYLPAELRSVIKSKLLHKINLYTYYLYLLSIMTRALWRIYEKSYFLGSVPRASRLRYFD